MMIDIYTDISLVSNLQRNNDLFFNTRTCNEKMTSVDIAVMMKIDNAVLKKDNRIETPYGLGFITNLSTGCKTIINILKYPNIVFSVDECGANVVETLFRIDGIKIFMTFPIYIHFRNDTIIRFNNTDVIKGEDEYYSWWQHKLREEQTDDL